MQKRSRRAHGIHTRKVSISVSSDDLRTLSARAKRLHGGNVSAVVHEMVDALRRLEAADQVLAMLGGDRVSEQDMQKVRDEVAAAPRRRSSRSSAA
jgi:macrodomain Ter protein organizer (MatP/YcbG family)